MSSALNPTYMLWPKQRPSSVSSTQGGGDREFCPKPYLHALAKPELLEGARRPATVSS